MRTIKEWLSEIDKADNEHNPRRRADLSDALVIELRGIFGTDDRLTEICQAERDGRLAVLPCKVGDVVYVIYKNKVQPVKVYAWRIDSKKNGLDMRFCVNGYFEQHYCGTDETYEHFYQSHFKLNSIGKTVFLTKESAEKALKGGV